MDNPEASPIQELPQDSLHLILSHLPLRQIVICCSVCKLFHQTLTSPSFLSLLSLRTPLSLLALRPRHASSHPTLHVFDPDLNQWFRFRLDFLPFRSTSPVASSPGLLYLWAGSPNSSDSNNTESSDSNKSLVVCNPLTRLFRVLPPLGSAWSRHGTVLPDAAGQVLVLSELAALYFSGTGGTWFNFSSNLGSKPRSPILVGESVFALCDVGSSWRSQWKLFSCKYAEFGNVKQPNSQQA